MQQLHEYAKELPDLCNRHSLRGIGPWHRVPHTCPCYCLAYSASRAVEAVTSVNNGEFPARTLAREWQRLHVGMEANAVSDKKAVPRRLCMESNFCTCRGDGRIVGRFWAKARQVLATQFGDKVLEKHLRTGCICIKWTPLLWADDGIGTPSNPKYTTIPFHSFKPWRPTLLAFDAVEAFSNDSGECVRLKLSSTGEGAPSFFSPHLYVNTLDLTCAWTLQLLVFSKLNKAFPNSAGEIMVRTWTDIEPHRFWNGKVAEMKRPRMKKSDQDNIVEESAADDAIALWEDSDCEMIATSGGGGGVPVEGVDDKQDLAGWIADIDSTGPEIEAGELKALQDWLVASESMRLVEGLGADQAEDSDHEQVARHEQGEEESERVNEDAECSSSGSSSSSSSSSSSTSGSTSKKSTAIVQHRVQMQMS
eukprot:6486926-Amphidinium_carterae.1